MPKVSIRERVRAVFKPDDDGMDLANGTNEWMVDVEIDGIGGDEQAEGDIDAMGPSDDVPCCLKGCSGLAGRLLGLAALQAAKIPFGVLGSCEFDQICDEQMAGDESVEGGTEEKVLLAVVVTADADQDTVLLGSLAIRHIGTRQRR